MCDNVNNNPFAGLFSTINDAVSFSSQNQTNINENNKVNHVAQLENKNIDNITGTINFQDSKDSKINNQVNCLLGDILGITLHRIEANEHQKCRLIFVNVDSIEQAVFERLMLSDLESKLVPIENSLFTDSHTIEKQVIPYLFESYCRLQKYQNKSEFSNILCKINQVILQNTSVALQEPELFEEQKIHNQFIALCMNGTELKSEFLSFINGIILELQTENEKNATDAIAVSFNPILDIIYKEAAQSNLVLFRQYWFTILNLFSSIEPLAKLLINHSTPKSNQGRAYADTLLGALFNLSCLPKTIEEPFYFFEKPLQLTSATIEGNIWTVLDALNESLQKVFHLLLKCSSEVRHLTLQWIGNCLHSNANRGKIWNAQNDVNFSSMLCVSDGFMLNLGNVLLRLCQPFCIKQNDSKVPKIDPTYCAADDECINSIIHLKGMTSETCLIPTSEGGARPVAKTFGFTTECFFLTHRALDLGYRVVLDKLLRANQDLLRIQRVYQDAQNGGRSEVFEMITQRMEEEMTKYLSLRASILLPEMLKLLAKFHATTAFWLVQVYLNEIGENEQNDYIPKECKVVTFPLPETVPDTLRCIPEFVIENTIRFLYLLRRLNPNIFEEQGSAFLTPVLSEIIVLMESQQRLYNPHLRARLAEALEALLPTTDETMSPVTPIIGTFHREQLFITHPYRQYIVPNLLKVFVSIEMTGQSVQFEQKFNYRRPMYIVMEYLWKLPEHRNNFISLAEEAETNMEAAQPPLFLRFINLLMNDAVFLLDEALSTMAQLKQLIQARESGEWNKLPQHERDQQAHYLLHLGMIARFDNILGRKTIYTLKMLTTEIKSIFCHPTMVDRIASMLNYLLLQLVGPNKKNLKVNGQKEYAFNPANLVLNICEIYINLSQNESFTLAVSQDGRSYSSELFKLADNVLVRIGGVGILGDLDQFAKNVEAAASHKKEEDEILIDAPDEFLDPIMSTLMTDPVILPSSKITIDRQTIARHLLSDQTDPFNRSPLTMDMVKSNIELQHRVQEWIQQKKQEKMKNCH
ncbi:ubiquitin conjugation factor E4 A isoform X2 [Apis cerana]|uniref:ubiquitin conjugation factor E4 A isoform X2 n=1 Tax=Apis cerana TaxID=7461 RepID=UPI0007E2CF0A|nr:ubiquitin conjugation factor E4 A isoform X2 [Apis cerana]XP_061943239.1 ubiquitin conjugation factor E4 A isoform X2 [Apis cerana]XP_061943245.1 ubiquitin conjugation factor E4 A isoform X2 [Apis cerana]XP_061943247.1 ubiquitin conjugation factor E4 A isoform X2 [Apis cerana]XP_061943251.1 ubiquitin conjugation factor E4 A isoform X2 [Apis cerana]